jgi:hypothetical protein
MKTNLSKREQSNVSHSPQVFYKYRSLAKDTNDFKRFVDIILNQRLYAAKYEGLNDPMEGVYYCRQRHSEMNKLIRTQLNTEIKICSLSEIKDDIPMWSHYADGHRGVILGVVIDQHKYDIRKIKYDGITFVRSWIHIRNTVEEILSHKAKCWAYEKEWRVFTFSDYIDVEIKEIILGSQMEPDDKTLVKEIVKTINPKIKVIEKPCY